jgi:hypothetical protein
MRIALVGMIVAALAGSALASEEEIHGWKSATITATTQLFGDVEVKATADAKGTVTAITVTAKGKTITVPAKWLTTLGTFPLSTLEIRSEVGNDPEPRLYVVFRTGPRTVTGSVEVHITFQGGKLIQAMLTTTEGKGRAAYLVKKAP